MPENLCEEILACLSANNLVPNQNPPDPLGTLVSGLDDGALWALAAGAANVSGPLGVTAALVAGVYGAIEPEIGAGATVWRDTIIPSLGIIYGEMISRTLDAYEEFAVNSIADFWLRLNDLQGVPGGFWYSDTLPDLSVFEKDPELQGFLDFIRNPPDDLDNPTNLRAAREWALALIRSNHHLTEDQVLEIYSALLSQSNDLENPKNPVGDVFRRIVQGELQGGKDGTGVLPQIEKIERKSAKIDEKVQEVTTQHNAQIASLNGQLNQLRGDVDRLMRQGNLYRPAEHNQQPKPGQPVIDP